MGKINWTKGYQLSKVLTEQGEKNQTNLLMKKINRMIPLKKTSQNVHFCKMQQSTLQQKYYLTPLNLQVNKHYDDDDDDDDNDADAFLAF